MRTVYYLQYARSYLDHETAHKSLPSAFFLLNCIHLQVFIQAISCSSLWAKELNRKLSFETQSYNLILK